MMIFYSVLFAYNMKLRDHYNLRPEKQAVSHSIGIEKVDGRRYFYYLPGSAEIARRDSELLFESPDVRLLILESVVQGNI